MAKRMMMIMMATILLRSIIITKCIICWHCRYDALNAASFNATPPEVHLNRALRFVLFLALVQWFQARQRVTRTRGPNQRKPGNLNY